MEETCSHSLALRHTLVQGRGVLDVLFIWCMSSVLNVIVKGEQLYIEAVQVVISWTNFSRVLIGSDT